MHTIGHESVKKEGEILSFVAMNVIREHYVKNKVSTERNKPHKLLQV